MAKEKKKKKRSTMLTKIKYKLAPELIAIVGVKISSRPQLMKLIWVYIKKNKLQDPNDGRWIECDEKMKAAFGKDRLFMYDIAKLGSLILERVK